MNTNKKKIGIFDSGIGGITFLRKAVKALPFEDFVYYADTDNVPYGIKPKEEVKQYIFRAIDFLAGRNIKILVIACNSATSAAINDLRQEYRFPIIGMEPAIKPAVENCVNKRVLVLSTTLTMNEEKLNFLISNVDKHNRVDKIAMDRLVGFAEEFNFDGEEPVEYIRNTLPENITDYGTVVLGCTHFIFFHPVFRKILPDNIEVIDGNAGTLNHMINIMKTNNILSGNNKAGSIEFYSSGRKDGDERLKKIKKIL